jgi:hypothetical protein
MNTSRIIRMVSLLLLVGFIAVFGAMNLLSEAKGPGPASDEKNAPNADAKNTGSKDAAPSADANNAGEKAAPMADAQGAPKGDASLAKVDLAVTEVKVITQKPTIRNSIQLDVTVKNLDPAKKTVFIQGFPFLSYGVQGFQPATYILPFAMNLAPGQEYHTALTVLPFTPQAGNYNIVVTVDPGNKSGDPNVSNNSKTVTLTLVLPSINTLVPSGSGTSSPITPRKPGM